MSDSDESKRPPRSDVLGVLGLAEGGSGLRVLRKRDDVLELGEIRPLEEGKPIQGEVVKLVKCAENERLFDVEVLVPAAKPLTARSGPAQVATHAYREGWDSIFGEAPGRGAPN